MPELPRGRGRRLWRVARLPVVVVLIVAAAGAIAWAASRPASHGRPQARIPAFSLPRLHGGTLTAADLRGHPVVLNFFASWCHPCRQEAPLLERAYRRFGPRGVRFVGVATGDEPVHARRFVAHYGVTYPVVLDPRRSLARAMGIYGLPDTFFIGARGTYPGKPRLGSSGAAAGTPVAGQIDEQRLLAGIRYLLERKGAQ